MKRLAYGVEHEEFREMAAAFVAAEVTPNTAAWDEAGATGRAFYEAAGAAGLLGFAFDPELGGLGIDDFRFSAVLTEELVRVGAIAVSMNLGGLNDLVVPYLSMLLTDAQRKQWVPGICAGTTITALGISEPGAGSDLHGLRTRARRSSGGWVLDGAKTFISNGVQADVVLTVARTGEKELSLFLVPTDAPGFSRGTPLAKTGLKAQDTAELFFDGVSLPPEALVGEEGRGSAYLRSNLPVERMSVAVTAVAACRMLLDLTLPHVRERVAFGMPIGSHQHNAFALAELATETQIAETFVDRCLLELAAGELDPVDAAMAKWWTTELQQKVGYRCQQLFGGYGVMAEYPVARAVLDGRPSTIYAGSTEIMKLIISRSMGL